MAEINYSEQQVIEKLLFMQDGYVSDFSDRTFRIFISDFFNIDINHQKYQDAGTSKAKKLRTLIKKESNFIVAVILEGLIEHQIEIDKQQGNLRELIYTSARNLVSKLKQETPVENLASIRAIDGDENFTVLSESVRKSIEQNKPIEAIDRLHTYMVRYSRKLCTKHAIPFNTADALNGLFGSYVRKLKEDKIVESIMTVEILGSYVKILDKYNYVRNNESMAHDNELINGSEALLILNSIANLIKFVDNLEEFIDVQRSNCTELSDDPPF